MTAEIPLTQGLVALVDDGDADRVIAAGKWSAHRGGGGKKVYARKQIGGRGVLLHTFLTGWSRVDHVNGDGLDNRRANLRPATSAENMHNRGLNQNSTTGYKGVSYRPNLRKWIAGIRVDGRRIHLGTHETAASAARAYDDAATLHFGQFARLNFPSPTRPLAHHTRDV